MMATSILFPLGQTVATPGALEALLRNKTLPTHLLARHQARDWGDVDAEDKRANDRDLTPAGQRLRSAALHQAIICAHCEPWVASVLHSVEEDTFRRYDGVR
jgi:hypothetical protein